MNCKKCEEDKCFFHLTKEIVLNNEFEFIKEWINNLYINHKFSTRSFIIHMNNKDKISFYNLLIYSYPRLLKQLYHTDFNQDILSNITNYILSLAKKANIRMLPENLSVYLKSSKILMKNIDKRLLKEKHLILCVQKQNMPLNESIDNCFSSKIGNDLKNIINFYRKRDRIILRRLHCLPRNINYIIINMID